MPETAASQPVVVCNSGPLIALACVGQLGILRKLFRQVLIPPAVFREVTQSLVLPGAAQVFAADWIQQTPLLAAPDSMLRSELGAGEAEVIALALEKRAALVLLDEHKGRRIAEFTYR